VLGEGPFQAHAGEVQPPEAPGAGGARRRRPAVARRWRRGLGAGHDGAADPRRRAAGGDEAGLVEALVGVQPERVQAGDGDLAQQEVDEVVELVVAGVEELALVDVEARDLGPEVPPPPGEGARLHHLPGLHAAHDLVEEVVRQGVQPVAAASIVAAALPLAEGFHRASCALN